MYYSSSWTSKSTSASPWPRMCVRQPLAVQPKRRSPEEAVVPNEPPAKKGRAKGQNSSTIARRERERRSVVVWERGGVPPIPQGGKFIY